MASDISRTRTFMALNAVTWSVIGCCLLIRDSYQKWNESPVIVSLSERMTSISTIPFPAVTICPEIRSKKGVFDFTTVFHKLKFNESPGFGLTENELKLWVSSMQICDKGITLSIFNYFDEKFTNESIFDSIKLMAPDMNESLVECRFRSKVLPCEDMFQDIITQDGLCFTFNSLTRDNMFHNGINFEMNGDMIRGLTGRWTMENGYENETEDAAADLYPYRVLGAGSSIGLSIELSVKIADLDYVCRGPVKGFKVILHSPNELPDVESQHFHVQFDNDVRMSIKPIVMVTDRSLENYSSDRRQCYFNSERKLRFMREYTQQNCLLECVANFTSQICGCVQFYMPQNNDTPICGESNTFCSLSMQDIIRESDEADLNVCKCLPACTSIAYEAEMSQGKYEFREHRSALGVSTLPEGFKMARLSVFFKESQFISSKRSELMGMTDFVAVCGGLLGLFMGISLLSIVELVYYFSLRVVFGCRSY